MNNASYKILNWIEGDPSSRPQSEVKAWTPPDVPPPVAQSAPPTLAQGQASLS